MLSRFLDKTLAPEVMPHDTIVRQQGKTKATYRNAYGPGVYRSQNASREMGLSIRCVKD